MIPMRTHRFPPLAQVRARIAREAAPAGAIEASSVEAFQQGLDKGYHEGFREGYEGGLQAGRDDGHKEGFGEGVKEARAQFESMAQPVDALMQALEQIQADYQSALREEVVDLVAKVARQVIRCEMALQPTQVLALVDEALQAMPPAGDKIEVFLNPEELQRISELAPERAGQWKLIPDSRLEPGECRVKAGDREADAGCRQRLAACMENSRSQLTEPSTMPSTAPSTTPSTVPIHDELTA